MPPRTRYPIILAPSQRTSLEALAAARSRPWREVRAARILLRRAAGIPVRQIQVELRCGSGTIARLCRRFCESGWTAARTEARRGRPTAYSDRDRQRVLDWATAAPQALGLPLTRWSLAGLQRCWRRRLRRRPPARSTLQRWLTAAAIPWFRTRSWCRTNDPAYHAKARAICDAYRLLNPDTAVLCDDQKPHLQALSRRHPNRPPRAGRAGQRDHDYLRHGTVCVHALHDVRTGRCRLATRPDHCGTTIAKLLGRWCADRPEPRLLLVMDNLSANHPPAVQQALRRCGKQVEVLRTPTYSSWLNQVEAVFGHLQRELLDNLQSCPVDQLRRQLRGWFQSWNARANPFRWTFHVDSDLCGTDH